MRGVSSAGSTRESPGLGRGFLRAPGIARHGLRFGVYLSPWDRHDPRYKDSAAYDRYYVVDDLGRIGLDGV